MVISGPRILSDESRSYLSENKSISNTNRPSETNFCSHRPSLRLIHHRVFVRIHFTLEDRALIQMEKSVKNTNWVENLHQLNGLQSWMVGCCRRGNKVCNSIRWVQSSGSSQEEDWGMTRWVWTRGVRTRVMQTKGVRTRGVRTRGLKYE